ncbi:MAG: hypothetical protein PHH01_03655 [Patescibacteria group bacterium]|nr:hypothetical protein [Patescibacteria group bacterium]MDD5567263.1 hypothetical protein [Patescibacteria group bacterium]
MKASSLFFACMVCVLAGTISGCTVIRGGLYVGFNPVGAICGKVLTIKDGSGYRYLGDEKISTDGNTTTWAISQIATLDRGVHFGIRPRTLYGMYIWRVEWRQADGEWHRIRFQNYQANPYEFTANRKAIGACQIEMRIIYRLATATPDCIDGTVIIGSDEPEHDIIVESDVVHHYLIPITFLSRYCDLR